MIRFNFLSGIVTVVTLGLAVLAVAQPGNGRSAGVESGEVVDGTIPAARPGLPRIEASGAQGPIRTAPRPSADPSIRPFQGGPDISNGLWEMQLGDQIVNPNSAQGSGTYRPSE